MKLYVIIVSLLLKEMLRKISRDVFAYRQTFAINLSLLQRFTSRWRKWPLEMGLRPSFLLKMVWFQAQFIAQSIGQAFQVAYVEFLKANGIEDHSFVKEMDYQEVLNSQEIFGNELALFAKKELQKEVINQGCQIWCHALVVPFWRLLVSSLLQKCPFISRSEGC